jgi:hypothetical protein
VLYSSTAASRRELGNLTLASEKVASIHELEIVKRYSIDKPEVHLSPRF